MFLSPTYYDVCLFIGFCMSDSNDRVTSIPVHQTWNLRYSRHFRITNCVSLELFFLAINLDTVSSFDVLTI